MVIPSVRSLLQEIDAFRAETGMSATAFGEKSLNDGGFLRGLAKRGRSPGLETVERVRNFMSSYPGEVA